MRWLYLIILIFTEISFAKSHRSVELPTKLRKENTKLMADLTEAIQDSKEILRKTSLNKKLKKKDADAIRALEDNFDKLNKLLQTY